MGRAERCHLATELACARGEQIRMIRSNSSCWLQMFHAGVCSGKEVFTGTLPPCSFHCQALNYSETVVNIYLFLWVLGAPSSE
jgi:hypothetical protein